jgi:hypothetical protein
VDSLYHEAIFTLQRYSDELQNRSELKREVDKIKTLLKTVKDSMRIPSPLRGHLSFASPPTQPGGLTESQIADFRQLAFDLTATDGPECQKCHIIDDASILRVWPDQRVLLRAEFNHRVHVLERRCTECHTSFAVDEKRLQYAVENYSEFKQIFANTFKADRAVTQNIPQIASCQACHTAGRTDNRCVTCHKFHPNKEKRANLQLFVQK